MSDGGEAEGFQVSDQADRVSEASEHSDILTAEPTTPYYCCCRCFMNSQEREEGQRPRGEVVVEGEVRSKVEGVGYSETRSRSKQGKLESSL